MSTFNLSVGLVSEPTIDIVRTLDEAIDGGFEFIAAPLFHPRQRRDAAGVSDARQGPGTRSDMVMEGHRWNTSVVGCVSPWLRLDSSDAHLRQASEAAVKQELAWASHLGVPAVLLPPPTAECANYAAAINAAVSSGAVHAWVRVPVIPAASPDASPIADAAAAAAAPDAWQIWNTFRLLAGSSPHLHVCLDIGPQLPSEVELSRWLGEPVKAAILHTSAFLTNKAGFPALPRAHQTFILQLMQHKVQFLLAGRPLSTPHTPAPASAAAAPAAAAAAAPLPVGTPLRLGHAPSYNPYLAYLRHLISRLPAFSDKDEFEAPYYDFLQAPLQPLADNLESATYETFEKDPVKYEQYRLAILAALRDRKGKLPEPMIITVVGAGRGPLVRRALAAAEEAGVAVRVFAVEKNANAVITLRNLKATLGWGDTVTIVAGDMRDTHAPLPKADLLVSELLGSFSDNELSPECLDGAQSLMKLPPSLPSAADAAHHSAPALPEPQPLPLPPAAVSIPASYTSYIQPVMSSKLWNAVRSYKEDKWFETPFVVRLFNFTPLSAAPLPVFTFVHPNLQQPRPDNRRYTRLTFTAVTTALIHGFAGYFHSTLYGDVCLSIEPGSHSPGMFSWFPIFFPLADPVHVTAGQTIELHMWRKVSEATHKVWYEWALTAPQTTAIHNPGGRSYYIGL